MSETRRGRVVSGLKWTGGVCAGFMIVLTLGSGAVRSQDRPAGKAEDSPIAAVAKKIAGAYKSGALAVTWKEGGKAFEYRKDGKIYRYDVASKKAAEVKPEKPEAPPARPAGGRFAGRARGRQFDAALSPDGTLRAFHRARNLWLSDPKGVIESAVTTDGKDSTRVKYGKASWVYGEELFQDTAIWWSPDSQKVAYYRFDESRVSDYYLALGQADLQTRLDAEPYPKAGTPNPIADLYVFDLKTKVSVKIDVRDGKPFDDQVLGHYVYRVSWSNDSKALLFHRTNRLQNVLELVAANPVSGVCRVVVREEWPASWIENNPEMKILKDGNRFLWATERTGWKNYELWDLTGKRLAALTSHAFEAARVVRVDEDAGVVDYLARSGDNPLKIQLHRVGLDGKNDRRLTDPALNHSVDVAPDGRHFIDVAQTHDKAPVTRLVDADGKVIDTLSVSDLSKLDALGLKRVELFTFKADDGATDLYGMLHRPAKFDAAKIYPLLVSVYAGPETDGASETFTLPNVYSEFGYLVATLDSRSAGGRGKSFRDAIYRRLGQVEIDDQAAGVKALQRRPYVDGKRVGVFGGSYGGYASIMCLLRHPGVFRAACASSSVTDYRNYDTIYTERYMRTPAENKAGYDAGSGVVHAADLKGRLMLYYGTADNNVHPSNTLQLIAALNRARKRYDLQVGPDAGHSGISRERMLEFFNESLATKPPIGNVGDRPRTSERLR